VAKERSFRARWSEGLEDYGYTQISNVFIERYAALGINGAQAMFIIQLMEYKWDVNSPYPAYEAIAKKCNVKTATVRTYAKALERKGLLKRVPRPGYTNEFDLSPLIARLEYIAPYKKYSNEDIRIILKPYQNSNTKEDPLRKNILKRDVIKDINN
jgi:hypothetical protein